MTTNNTRKIVTLIAVLIIGATMSGCIETRTISEPKVMPTTESIYMASEIPEYIKGHDLSAKFDGLHLVFHPDRTVTVNDITGTWANVGTGDSKYRCAISGIEDVEYVYFHDGRVATGYRGAMKLNGVWFR